MYTTIRGYKIPEPWKLIAEICTDSRNMMKDTRSTEWFHAYQKLYDQMRALDLECTDLREENKRLGHENEFMRRMFEDRLNKDPDA